MVLERGMQPLPLRDGEELDRNIFREVERERKRMLVFVSMGEWNSVLKILSQDCPTTSIFRLLPMNSSKDTFVHLAATEGQTEVVRKLLKLTKENDMGAGAPLANVTGNTPLHLAAAHGHEETCRSIIEEAPEMGAARNVDGETPIFVAALSGSKKAFSTLSSMLTDAKDIALVRRNDGDTILHCAVSGEYFDLASEIIERFSQLVYYRNERGLTPLHILANNPSAFRSGCRLLLLNRLLYASIKVSTEPKSDEPRQKQEDYPSKLVGNYLLCWTFFKLWKSTFAALGQCLWSRGANISTKSFMRFFRFLLAILHVILALSGFSRRITKMRKKKQKHIWANKVMHQLLVHIEHWWDFGEINTGMDPYRFRLEGSRGGSPGSAVPAGEIPIALQLEKEIASASETNSIQESQRFPSTRSLLSDPSSSSIPRTDSNMLSSAVDASSNLSKEVLKGGNTRAYY
ncbi:hypothetical protein MRB53_000571 [Persea americana]|uniref:Uncharacterized protein n=1 Tax=Persea americana TaxID=3435 RepID=A0ACC2MQ62_PERAE|nr:hypothetical protein MRB53_000571 [Persea americana]